MSVATADCNMNGSTSKVSLKSALKKSKNEMKQRMSSRTSVNRPSLHSNAPSTYRGSTYSSAPLIADSKPLWWNTVAEEMSSLKQWLDLAVVHKLTNLEANVGLLRMEMANLSRAGLDNGATKQSVHDSLYQPMPRGDMEYSSPTAEPNDLWSSAQYLPKAGHPQSLQPNGNLEGPGNDDTRNPTGRTRYDSEFQPDGSHRMAVFDVTDAGKVVERVASVQKAAERVIQKVTSTKRIKHTLVWSFLDDPESSRAALWYLNAKICFICVSVGTSLIQSIEPPLFAGTMAFVIDSFFECVFFIELGCRFAFCPDHKRFAWNVYNWFDFAAVVPLVFRIRALIASPDYSKEDSVLALVGVTPMLRIMKTLRHFQQFQLLLSAGSLCLEALPICLFAMLTLTLIFSAMIFLAEPRTNIESLPKVMYLVIVTMTTLGYGDVLPSTAAGYLGLSLIVVSSVMFTAMPLGIIGQAFTTVWQDRDRILLLHSVRSRIRIWGYDPSDIPALFQVFDSDDSGELVVTEFKHMLEEMNIGLPDTRIIELFQSIDLDGGGSIDAKEFVQALFPEYCAQLFADEVF